MRQSHIPAICHFPTDITLGLSMKRTSKTSCGVVLFPEAYAALDALLGSYVRESRSIGKYIYCSSAEQNGAFIDMKFAPEDCDGKIASRMTISVPAHFVMFMASGEIEKPLGFTSHE